GGRVGAVGRRAERKRGAEVEAGATCQGRGGGFGGGAVFGGLIAVDFDAPAERGRGATGRQAHGGAGCGQAGERAFSGGDLFAGVAFVAFEALTAHRVVAVVYGHSPKGDPGADEGDRGACPPDDDVEAVIGRSQTRLQHGGNPLVVEA